MSDAPTRTRLILVRHGATEWTESGRYQGSADIPLSAAGLLEAERVATALSAVRLGAVVCSPLRRAVQTATAIAAPRGLSVALRPAFREVSFGEWEGLTGDEAAAPDRALYGSWKEGHSSTRPPGGESIGDAAARAIPALEALVSEHPGKKAVVVTHSRILRVLLCRALGADLSASAHMRCEPGSISVIDVRDGLYVVRALNDTGHLRP